VTGYVRTGDRCRGCGEELEYHPATRTTWHASRRAHDHDAEPPFGPSYWGSARCQSGSLASGGTKTFCTCDVCF
jgi:hypothetical protein